MSALRKSVMGKPVDDPELQALLDNLPKAELTEDQLTKQRASFIFGNSPENSTVTKESASHAADSVLI